MSPTIVLKNGHFDFAVGSPGGSTIITTVLQILLNHIDFGMSLPRSDRRAAREPAQHDDEHCRARVLRQHDPHPAADQYGEQFTEATGTVLPLNSWIGNATGIQRLPGGRYVAAAEPVRQRGGSALVVQPSS